MQLQDLTLHFLPCRTRLPFRFGKVVMEEAPMLIARVAVRTGAGGAGVGVAADLLVPKWFDKKSSTSIEEDRAALVESARAAGEAWTAMPAELALFEQWDRVRRILVDGAGSSTPTLVRLFGSPYFRIVAACPDGRGGPVRRSRMGLGRGARRGAPGAPARAIFFRQSGGSEIMMSATIPRTFAKFSAEEKAALVHALAASGENATVFAERHDLQGAQLYQWRMAIQGRIRGRAGFSGTRTLD